MDPVHQHDILVKCMQSCHSNSEVQRQQTQQARLGWTTGLADSGALKSKAVRPISCNLPFSKTRSLWPKNILYKGTAQPLRQLPQWNVFIPIFKWRKQKKLVEFCRLSSIKKHSYSIWGRVNQKCLVLVLFPRLNNSSSSLELCINWH